MKNRVCQCILFVFFLIAVIGLKFMVLAEELNSAGLIVRPAMEYKSDDLRDPFKTYIIKEQPEVVILDHKELPKQPEFDLDKLKVQGIIWGVKTPQAIINGRVLTIGDSIEGAQIVNIEKKGITLSFDGAMFDLCAPRHSSGQIQGY
jgi:hypothetical protein